MSNPFSTRFIKPGALSFIPAGAERYEDHLARLRSNHWFGEIVGPHGVGKSTFLAGFLELLRTTDRKLEIHPILAHDRRATIRAALHAPLSAAALLVIDGFEQLSWWHRRRTIRRCRLHGAGLLVTTHASAGLPPLIELKPDLESAQRVVRGLVGEDRTISSDDVAAAFAAQQGNVRETLFALYDLYEARTQVKRQPSAGEALG